MSVALMKLDDSYDGVLGYPLRLYMYVGIHFTDLLSRIFRSFLFVAPICHLELLDGNLKLAGNISR